ncbi:cytochrome-c peroxidase [Pinibacter aurantiacus]|uniref:C-type cytochrome n=1 Tax=Pinibacter aurantiacus TaxID=2851599 RepID=A0A9E2SBR7_9BACT|nr:cytochrome c peroxidase [Pinibacter aurantiacus]MBV4358468.1 c-type cytochrome [Pinibacter aurantiacus]
MKSLLTLLLPLPLLIVGCNNNSPQSPQSASAQVTDSLQSKAQGLFKLLPNVDSAALSPEKIELGKTLYYDTRLSFTGNNSCNSCHNISTYGVDNLPVSPGDKGENGVRNSPTVFNAALHAMQFWDGRAKTIEQQAGMPILNPAEMNIPNQKFLIDRLNKIEYYQKEFAKAFPNDKSPLTYDNIQNAIGSFERTLITPSKFDAYLVGDSKALDENEKKGLGVFIKAGCTACHSGQNLGGEMLQKFGLNADYWTQTKSKKVDSGLYSITKKESDKFIFKVPSLRNIEKTAPYFHDGSVSDLKDAIKIMATLQTNTSLTDDDIKNVEAFLKTLTSSIPDSAKEAPKVLAENSILLKDRKK